VDELWQEVEQLNQDTNQRKDEKDRDNATNYAHAEWNVYTNLNGTDDDLESMLLNPLVIRPVPRPRNGEGLDNDDDRTNSR